MPRVGGKCYAYTKAGRAAAQVVRRRLAKKKKKNKYSGALAGA